MTDQRSALDVEAVIARFDAAEQLLSEAASRVQALGSAAETASQNANSLHESATSTRTASEQLAAMVSEMKSAHEALVGAMDLARQFLEATDVTAVRESLQQLDQRMNGLELSVGAMSDQLVGVTGDLTQRLNTFSDAIDRSAALERERDEAQRRLTSVMQQLPNRIAKKVQ